MQQFDSLIFDLDGTLWDTNKACAAAWNNVLQQHAIPFRKITEEDILSVVGKPHEECIRVVFNGLPEHSLQLLIQGTMVEDNKMVEELGGELYDGVEAGIRQLSDNYSLFIVSNCQTGYIETFLRYSNLSHHFKDIECWGNTRKSKSENTSLLISRNQIKSPLFIGDTPGDRKAATDNYIPFGFARYGFGEVETSDFSFESFHQLTNWLLTK